MAVSRWWPHAKSPPPLSANRISASTVLCIVFVQRKDIKRPPGEILSTPDVLGEAYSDDSESDLPLPRYCLRSRTPLLRKWRVFPAVQTPTGAHRTNGTVFTAAGKQSARTRSFTTRLFRSDVTAWVSVLVFLVDVSQRTQNWKWMTYHQDLPSLSNNYIYLGFSIFVPWVFHETSTNSMRV